MIEIMIVFHMKYDEFITYYYICMYNFFLVLTNLITIFV